jgi:hypothetical protein
MRLSKRANMQSKNSTNETFKHIKRVEQLIGKIIKELLIRAEEHDSAKITNPKEKPLFDNHSLDLKNLEYGSKEYKQSLKELEPALKHHYSVYRHHPEHFEKGIDEMNLIDILEMLADWKASSERYKEGDIRKSLKINAKRFKINPKVMKLLENTLDFLGW